MFPSKGTGWVGLDPEWKIPLLFFFFETDPKQKDFNIVLKKRSQVCMAYQQWVKLQKSEQHSTASIQGADIAIHVFIAMPRQLEDEKLLLHPLLPD